MKQKKGNSYSLIVMLIHIYNLGMMKKKKNKKEKKMSMVGFY